MRAWAIASGLALGTMLGAAAPGPPSNWQRTPADGDFLKALPAETVAQGLVGRAVIRCRVAGGGELSDCTVVTESPAGAGYGKALLTIAPSYQLRPDKVAELAPSGFIMIVRGRFPSDKAPDWLRKPTAEDLLVVWPKEAWRRGLGGKAIITCMVSVQGALFDCVTIFEAPAGQPFGAAAIALTPQFLLRPAIYKGQPVVSEVNIPINFTMPAGSTGQNSDGGRKMAQPAMAWLEAPSYAQVIAAYPKKARADGVLGRATLNCEFTSTGRLEHCSTVAEEPKGQGFAEAAKALSKQFRAPSKTSDGKSMSGVDVQLPFAFDRSMQTETVPAVGKPLWASLPTAEETNAAFATVAKTVEGTVRVTLTCTVQTGGSVDGCAIVREDPAGKGVGQAALSLATHFRLTTWTMEGLPTVGATINIPLRYEGAVQPAATTPAKP